MSQYLTAKGTDYDTFHYDSHISNITDSHSNTRPLHKSIIMKFVDEVICRFSHAERQYYEALTPRVKSAYCSYINNHKKQNIKVAIQPPRQWDRARAEKESLTSFDEIATALKLSSPSHAYTYYKQGMKHILKLIKGNPHRYKAIIDAGGLTL